MDKVEQLYNLYLQKGLITSATTLDMFRAANEQQQSSLYDLGKRKNLFSTTDLGTFQSAWGGQQAAPQPQEDLKKKEESVTMGSPSVASSSASQRQTDLSNFDFGTIGQQQTQNQQLGIKGIKDVDFGAIKEKVDQEEAQKTESPFYKPSLETITPDLIDMSEEYVVPQMNYQFGPMGFKFEESGNTGDWMLVTAPNGEKREFSLDPVFSSSAEKTSKELKQWIEDNTEVSGLKSLEKQYAEENKKFSTDEEVDVAFKAFDADVVTLKNDITGFLQERQRLDSEKTALDSVPFDKRNDPEYKQKQDAYTQKAASLDKRMQDLSLREEQIKSGAVKLERAVGKYTSMKSEQGWWPGGILDSIMRGVGKQASGTVNAVIDAALSKYVGGVGEDEISNSLPDSKATGDALQDAKNGGVALSNAYKISEAYNKAIAEERAKGVDERFMTVPIGTPKPIPMPTAGQSYKDWWNSLSSDQKTAIVDKSNDDIKKDLKVNLLPAMRTGAEVVLGDPSTTVQWADLKKQGFWGGAFLGVAESLPAMVGSNTAIGWAQRTAAMYAQTSDAVYEEMSNNPAFDDISESEKLSVVAPIGITSAVLESIGLRNIVANKGLMNRIVLSAMGKAGVTTTAKTFGELVKNEVNSMVARGLITAGGAMLAEAETGAAQQISEYAFKEIYNAAKGKDMFQTPDFLSAEYIKDIAVAGAQEAVGGFVLGVPSAVSAAYSKKGFLSMDDKQFEFFRQAANDSKIEQAYVVNLKQKAATGEMTMKQAKEALNDYRNSVGLYRSVPEELSTQDAKEAMNLLKEKKALEQQIEGKDEALVKRQKNRIAEINESLNKLSENAVQESSTEEVLPREQGAATETGGERGGMGQGVQGQEATQESAQEKVSVLSSPETITVALEQVPTEERTNITFMQEDGTETPVMGNENMLAQAYAEATAVAEEDRTDAQRSAIDAVELSLKEQLDQEMASSMQEIADEVNALDDGQVYTFEAPTMEQVPEQFRETAEVVPAAEVTTRKKLFGLIPYGKAETRTVGQEVVRYTATGAEAKQAYAQVVATNPQFRPRVAENKESVARNTARSIASVFPDLEITTHNNAEEMRVFAEQKFGKGSTVEVLGDEGGMIVYDQNNKPIAIMINDEVSDATTLPHEAWHGIFIKAFGQNEQLFSEFRDSIKKRLSDNGFTEIADQLDEFSQTEEYQQSNSQAEEWLAQFGGLLTASGITANNLTPRAKTLLQQIKDVFNDVAKKITGSPMFLEDATPADVLDFMVAISDRMRRGESIADFFREQQQQEEQQQEEKPKEGFVLKSKNKGIHQYTYNGINASIEYDDGVKGWMYFYETPNGTTQGGDDVFRTLKQARKALSQFLDEQSAKGKDEKSKAARSSKQKTGGDAGTLAQVKKIATRYNINNQGFAPRQVDEKALARELAPLGYGARRAKPTADGYGGGVFITNARGSFFNPFKVSRQRASKAAKLQADLSTIEGYDQMVNDLNELAENRRRLGDNKEEIANKLMDAAVASAAYQNATDIQREQIIREIRKQFGIKEKSAPSVARILGTLGNVKKITMSEKELLKGQIKALARGAKDAKRAWMLASAELSKAIKEMATSGKISTKQAANVIRKFSKVNMFNQDSIDRFVDYMAKVFEDAQYMENIERARSMSAIARKNIKTKIGAANEISSELRRMFSIDPSLIPDSVFQTYMDILEQFGKREAVLVPSEISSVSSKVSEVLDAVNEEVSKAEELAERFDVYQDKVYKDGNLVYSETLQNMIEDGTITEEEAEVMRKYKSIISPRAENLERTEQEIQDEKDQAISGIMNQAIDTSLLSSKDEIDLAERLSRMLKPELLDRMTVAQLNNIAKLIDSINNGYMPHFAQLTVERLNAINNAVTGNKTIKKAKPLVVSKIYSNIKSKFTGRDALLEMIRSVPLYVIGEQFGDFKTKGLFSAVFKGLAEKHAMFDSEMKRVNKILDNAHNAVAKSFGYNANDTLMSSFKMMTYMLQKEYESNPGSNQVNPAIEYLKKTIDMLNKKPSKVNDLEAKMLTEIMDKYSTDDQIDAEKLFESFNRAEVAAIDAIRKINDSLSDKASYTAAVIRGKRIDPLNNYVHHFAKTGLKPSDKASATQLSDQYNRSMMPSTRAMNLLDRQKKPTALNFDVFASAQRGAKFTLLDYNMTEAIRTARKTINEMRTQLEEDGITRDQRRLVDAIEEALDEVISSVLTNNFMSDSFFDEVLAFVSKQGYRAVLSGAPRFVSELTSNMGFAMILDPNSFLNGIRLLPSITGEQAVRFMENVNSIQTTRIYQGDTLSGAMIDKSILGQSSGVKSAKPKGAIENAANMIYNMSLKKYKNFVEMTADTLISTPDKMVMRPMWFGSFATEFKRQTGKEVDAEKIAENDSQYMSENREAIEAAKNFADERSVKVGASDNPFMGILKGTIDPNKRGFQKSLRAFNTYMTRFTTYEYLAARQGIYAAMGNGSISRKQGAALLGAVATRMTVYSMLTGLLTGSMLSLFSDEEEDEKTLLQSFSQAVSSTAVSLILNRNFGNAMKSIINYGVEDVNEDYLQDLRNGEYDPYKDAISFTSIPTGEGAEKTDIGTFVIRGAGSYGPALKTTNLFLKNLFGKEKKEADAIARSEDEKNIRLPLEILGMSGMVPLYKDLSKIVNHMIYKDLRNAEKNAEDKKKAEKEMLHGYENRTEMKRYDPELYEKVFGKDSPGYDAEQAKKKLKKEADALERKIKDEKYNYTPKEEEKKKGFGSKEFGDREFGGKENKKGGFGSKKFGE